jgi:hypothetical protein
MGSVADTSEVQALKQAVLLTVPIGEDRESAPALVLKVLDQKYIHTLDTQRHSPYSL